MIKLSLEAFFNRMNEKGYKVLREELQLNIVGCRDRFGRPNYFDDMLTVYFKEADTWMVRYFPATTMPGVPYLLKPVSDQGTAILVPGQYRDSYAIGSHRGKYDALIQVRPVRVYRDSKLDVLYDKDDRTIQEGMFGINIHRASLKAQIVGTDSAGCQVIRDREDYDNFIKLCERSRLHTGNTFTYTLVEL